MMIRVACRSCHQKLRVPAQMAGRTTICPRCKDAVPVPHEETLPTEEPVRASKPSKPAPPSPHDLSLPDVADWPWPSRLGLIAAGCGLFSLLTLCLPEARYLAILVGGGGLLLSLCALTLALLADEPGPGQVLAVRAGVVRRFGTRAVDVPLVGVAVCAVALAVNLVPLLME